MRSERGGGSDCAVLLAVITLLSNVENKLPFGKVRKGFPCEEVVNVALARRFWNSLGY